MPRWRVCHARRPPGGAGAAGSHSRPAQKMWSLPHGVVRGREFATSSRTRTGGRVVGSRHLNSRRPIGYGHFSLSPRIQLISVRSPPNSRANLLACAGRLDVLGREVSWGRRAWWSRAAVKPAVVPHVRDGSALPLMMTPRGGGMGAGGRRRARSGRTRRMCAEPRTGRGLCRGCTRHRRGQGHRRPHGATGRRHLH